MGQIRVYQILKEIPKRVISAARVWNSSEEYSWYPMVWPHRWHRHSYATGLSTIMDLNTRKHSSLFCHIARLGKDIPAYQAL